MKSLIISVLLILSTATIASANTQTRCYADKNASVCHTKVNGRLTSSTVTTRNKKPIRIVNGRRVVVKRSFPGNGTPRHTEGVKR